MKKGDKEQEASKADRKGRHKEADLWKVRPGLEIERHYKTVCKQVWEKFYKIYGGGPVIIKKEPEIYSEDAVKNSQPESKAIKKD